MRRVQELRYKKIYNKIGTTVLLALFAILTLASVWALYYTHQLPLNEELVTTLYEYEHYGTFNCIATLKPNIIYGNTTLNLSEGSVFRRITQEINADFTYTFTSTKPANLTIHCSVSQLVETLKWQKQIGLSQQKTFAASGTSLHITDIPTINLSSIQELVNKITEETGIRASEFVVTVAIEMRIEANTAEGPIIETFTPELTMRFTSGYTEGDLISIEDTQHTKTGEITSTETIYQPWIQTQRYLSYTLSIVSLPGLLITIWTYARSRPVRPLRPEALIEETIEPFEEVISKTAEEPQFKEHALMPLAKISMKTLEDLVKVADILEKPIVHARRPPETHIFYVIDETTRYEYTMTESSIIERMNKEEK
jgi:hypothetical protein